jgi:predicted 2-oxoglutarate/Fe(II)-dependent dioxygenase YbiX
LVPEFFTRFGLYVQPEFIDCEQRTGLLSAMRASVQRNGRVYVAGSGGFYDESRRSVKLSQVTGATRARVITLFENLRPVLESHFRITLDGNREPQFLVYREGDFFCPHSDTVNGEDAQGAPKVNKLAAVLFLNSEIDSEAARDQIGNDYSGGALTFYGLMKEQGGPQVGLPLTGRSGTVVVFPAHITHEVRRITGGERFTITCKYF